MNNRRFHNILVVVGSLCFAVLLLEAGLYFLSWAGWLPVDPPYYDTRDWGKPLSGMHFRDTNVHFGPWHQPGSTYIHRKAGGYSVEYVFNSIGARDRERSLRSNRPRAVIVGDSFIEGYALKTEDRLSDLLEAWSGTEVLNFGDAGNAGTVQYYLIYKHLASQFDHSFVLVGVLPSNDFMDNDYKAGLETMGFRYRPYIVGHYPNYELVYYNRDFLDSPDTRYPMSVVVRSLLVNFSMTYRTASYLKHILRSRQSTSDSIPSYYYDFSDEDWDKMRWSLERLCTLAHANRAEVIIFTIPTWGDVLRYRHDGDPPLSRQMRQLGEQVGYHYVDMLPGFAHKCSGQASSVLPEYWLKNDGHWTAAGNRLALEILKPVLCRIGFFTAVCD